MVYGGAINGVGLSNPNAYRLGGGVVYCVMGIPNGRVAANGLQPVRVTQVGIYAGGRNGAVTANVTVGTGQTGNFAMPGGGGGTYGLYGLGAAPAYFSGTQQTTLAINHDGSLNYGRGGVGGVNIYESGALAWSDATLVGDYWYEQVPAAPSMIAATPGPAGQVTVQFGGSGDTGDAAITGWQLQYADNPGFGGAVTVGSSGTTSFNLTPGKTYWFRAAGRNNVSDAYGTTGPWSGSIAATMRSGGKVSVNDQWRSGVVKVSVNDQWRDGIVRVSNGTTWKDAL
ncbi:fibronectin type III domain-containing protein [Plantibacter sp. VKM Ac-2876]|uniref:fibronectin type III domain-containing protein n=1 Tax=Plantibacter sp. VKM Ac-2876 TaxID=2783826 RepID=UPI00188BF9E3|nr:fibronectin type III domain-containing protein [Plantibacter sp. VKM Ac-2876]MBF4565405.1 fibronectin type III domain-containing protein [Plantibacter sp. VKM Ac-2876]